MLRIPGMRIVGTLAVLVLAACAQADDWSKEFTVTGRPEVQVRTGDGNVVLRAGPAGAVDLHVITRGWTIGSGGVRADARQNGNRIDVDVHVPSMNRGIGSRSVRVELIVPRNLTADVHTGDGNITAQGLAGELRFATGDGNIDADSLDGVLSARTGDGNLTVRGRFDRLELHTNDGSLNATAEAGSKPTGPWRIGTGDGDAVLRVPGNFAADLDLSTGDGSISVKLPATRSGFERSEHSFRGRLNGGGPQVRVSTGDGSIHLESL